MIGFRSPPSSDDDDFDVVTDEQPEGPSAVDIQASQKQAPKPEEKGPIVIPLASYLPLGCLQVNLLEAQHRIDSHDFVEAVEFLPHLKAAPALNTALTTLWRALWLKVFRFTAHSEPRHELWRLYILPDV